MSRLVDVPCPLCAHAGSMLELKITATDVHIRKYGSLYDGIEKSRWVACGRCGFVHQNPRPSVEDLNRFYLDAKYHDEIPAEWRDPAAYDQFGRWYYSEKLAFARKHSGLSTGSVFDIGVGYGHWLRLLSTQGWRVHGVEPDGHVAEFARSMVGPGVRTGILDASTDLGEQVDLVVSNHAFEHFAELDEVMRGIRNILRPGGWIFTVIPTYYRNRSRTSLEWMNAAHYSMFTHRSLGQLFARHGIETVAWTYRGWRKEIDDLWLIGRRTEATLDPASFHEDPETVRRYVNVVNPRRSLVRRPLYGNYVAKVHALERGRRLARSFAASPVGFLGRAIRRLTAPSAPRGR